MGPVRRFRWDTQRNENPRRSGGVFHHRRKSRIVQYTGNGCDVAVSFGVPLGGGEGLEARRT